jgi:hypothetical protein
MLAKFSSLPHGFELLKSNIHDKNKPPDNSELTMLGANELQLILISTLNPMSPWGTLLKLQTTSNNYIHLSWHILLLPSP